MNIIKVLLRRYYHNFISYSKVERTFNYSIVVKAPGLQRFKCRATNQERAFRIVTSELCKDFSLKL